MKKIFLGLMVLLMSACSLGVASTPKEKVKEFLDKYKNQDSSVLNDLDEIVSNEYSGDYADRYKNIMKKQYKNLSYTITDEIIEGDSATVIAEITVYNYASAIASANSYLSSNKSEFLLKDDTNSEGTDSTTNITSETIDYDKFNDYKLSSLENVTDTKTYSITITFNKVNDKWVMNNLSDIDIEKIHGLYQE